MPAQAVTGLIGPASVSVARSADDLTPADPDADKGRGGDACRSCPAFNSVHPSWSVSELISAESKTARGAASPTARWMDLLQVGRDRNATPCSQEPTGTAFHSRAKASEGKTAKAGQTYGRRTGLRVGAAGAWMPAGEAAMLPPHQFTDPPHEKQRRAASGGFTRTAPETATSLGCTTVAHRFGTRGNRVVTGRRDGHPFIVNGGSIAHDRGFGALREGRSLLTLWSWTGNVKPAGGGENSAGPIHCSGGGLGIHEPGSTDRILKRRQGRAACEHAICLVATRSSRKDASSANARLGRAVTGTTVVPNASGRIARRRPGPPHEFSSGVPQAGPRSSMTAAVKRRATAIRVATQNCSRGVGMPPPGAPLTQQGLATPGNPQGWVGPGRQRCKASDRRDRASDRRSGPRDSLYGEAAEMSCAAWSRGPRPAYLRSSSEVRGRARVARLRLDNPSFPTSSRGPQGSASAAVRGQPGRWPRDSEAAGRQRVAEAGWPPARARAMELVSNRTSHVSDRITGPAAARSRVGNQSGPRDPIIIGREAAC